MTETSAGPPLSVYLEVGKKRVFACAVDWPGWCRSAKSEELALETLAEYAPRYAVVTREAGIDFDANSLGPMEVVGRVPGSASTDFGVPGEVTQVDLSPVDAREAERLVAVITASWRIFDRVVANAPAELRKGPRGGGRDRDKIADHVVSAEAAYARKLGTKHRPPAADDTEAVAALRAAITDALGSPSDGKPPVPKGWPHRYAARRIAWHVIDHTWEIQDRSDPG
jgi:hypothetical protein